MKSNTEILVMLTKMIAEEKGRQKSSILMHNKAYHGGRIAILERIVAEITSDTQISNDLVSLVPIISSK